MNVGPQGCWGNLKQSKNCGDDELMNMSLQMVTVKAAKAMTSYQPDAMQQ